MRFSWMILCLATVLGSRVNFRNNCNYNVQVIRTANGQAPVVQANLSPRGGSSSGDFNGQGMNFKNGWNGLTLAEFSFNLWGLQDFYDLSVIVGFDTPMQIQSDRGVWVTCKNSGCPDAYHYPDDNSKNHGVSTGGTFTVVFCP